MHTDPTLDILSQVTTSLGSRLRAFQEKTCAAFQTRELERERLARQRRREKSATGTTPGSSKPAASSKSSRKLRQLNLRTYKYHSLGDYFNTIRRLGTTDSYSTQSVSCHSIPHLLFLNVGGEHQSELEHRTSKARFLRTSGQLIPQQLSRIEQRQRHITMICENLRHPLTPLPPKRHRRTLSMTLESSTTWGNHKNFLCTYQPFCKRTRVILLPRSVVSPYSTCTY